MSGFQKAKREKIKVKVLLAGPSGSGKTYTALRLAKGIASKTNGKVAAIDTETGRIRYYANEFDFDDMQLEKPFTPEKYLEAIGSASNGDYAVLIIDSITHEWEEILKIHDAMPGNSYTNWQKLTPRHDSFVKGILEAPIHIIATVRGKDEYVLEEKNGKQTPKKVGLGYKTRDGVEYEYTVTFNLAQDTHVADTTKDNTHLFEGNYEVLTEKHGEALFDWANSGEVAVKKVDLNTLRKDIITSAKNLGGSKNEDVAKATRGVNPNNCDDEIMLEEILKDLKKLESKKGE